MADTNKQFDVVVTECRSLFSKKLHDYGAAWRIMRPSSVTDQIFIKAKRIRSLELKGVSKVDEGIKPELIGIINYGIIGLIQLQDGFVDEIDMRVDRVLQLYDQHMETVKQLMLDKNHDYDEAWRSMRIQSYTDLILMKLLRVKQIEDLQGQTLVSEGLDANYMDMINYAIFGLIRMQFSDKED
ncbi:MAG: DUF1599 domain-containing protein [Bacteroidales bacterium]|jgi:hypothetical protein|nr:DUF1599 domain-containing protein [Bacteroidales bacterium]MDD3166536.1 DUF1599 domain-containing protein [Bacteroidales bacterium]MDD4771011.1 DUF1599 domain-containing protein [Bacteroidales bacterium]HKL92808.1 DUF1599 domain-containing protein [Bacteroidales bacterium]